MTPSTILRQKMKKTRLGELTQAARGPGREITQPSLHLLAEYGTQKKILQDISAMHRTPTPPSQRSAVRVGVIFRAETLHTLSKKLTLLRAATVQTVSPFPSPRSSSHPPRPNFLPSTSTSIIFIPRWLMHQEIDFRVGRGATDDPSFRSFREQISLMLKCRFLL